MAALLNVKDLCKTFIIDKRQNNVLKNINFTVDQGEMVAIMGPSGSGKSTLLYSVSGMDTITSGRVDFDGRELNKLSQNELSSLHLEEMGFVFQQMYMMKNLSIMDNILLPSLESKKDGKNNGKKGKAAKQEKARRAEELMRKMSIIEIADNDINEASGGQLQRACICRSMINNPKMIFADEPTGALNRASSVEVMDQLVKLNAEGTTIMMVTHDSSVASRCKRVLYLQDGNIKGEFLFSEDKYQTQKEKERSLNSWLVDMGW